MSTKKCMRMATRSVSCSRKKKERHMIDVAKSGTADMRMSTKMIADQALERGWKVEQYYAEGSQLQVTRPDGKVLELYSASSPVLPHIAAIRADDKYFTTLYLRDHGLPVPETYLVAGDQGAAAQA